MEIAQTQKMPTQSSEAVQHRLPSKALEVADQSLEAMLRGFLIKAHLSDEPTTEVFARLTAGITLPDLVVEYPILPRPVRLKQCFVEMDEAGDCTGGLLWDSSSMLLDWLSCNPAARLLFEGQTVLELGGGIGLVSISLALLGASRVILTDGHQSACARATANIELNQVGDRVGVAKLRWGDGPEAADQTEAALQHIGSAGLCAQTVVASDVLYDPEGIHLLELTLRSLIARGGCTHVVIGWRDRGWDESAFLRRLSHLGCVHTAWTMLPMDAVDDETRKDADGLRNRGVSVLTVGESEGQPSLA